MAVCVRLSQHSRTAFYQLLSRLGTTTTCSRCTYSSLECHKRQQKNPILPLSRRRSLTELSLTRRASTKAGLHDPPGQMEAWVLHQYGGQVTMTSSAHVPAVMSPSDVLVEVHAASLNPIDREVIEGRVTGVTRLLRCASGTTTPELPLTPGRDFSGVIAAKGCDVTAFSVGDEVWGAVSVNRQGSHAQYVTAAQSEISLKPMSVSHTEAASIPYVAASCWGGLVTLAHYSSRNSDGLRVYVPAASGGIGTFVTQLLKAWGCHVTATCSPAARDLVTSLGADVIIDYTASDVTDRVREAAGPGFDLVFDSLGQGTESLAYELLKTWQSASYITLVHPLLSRTSELGLGLGVASSAASLAAKTAQFARGGRRYVWSIFLPNGKALGNVAALVDSGQIRPVLDSVYSLEQLPDALARLAEGHTRGKVVLNVRSS